MLRNARCISRLHGRDKEVQFAVYEESWSTIRMLVLIQVRARAKMLFESFWPPQCISAQAQSSGFLPSDVTSKNHTPWGWEYKKRNSLDFRLPFSSASYRSTSGTLFRQRAPFASLARQLFTVPFLGLNIYIYV